MAAGSPIEAEEDPSGYVYLDYAQKQFGADCFALRVVGDSMDMANMPGREHRDRCGGRAMCAMARSVRC